MTTLRRSQTVFLQCYNHLDWFIFVLPVSFIQIFNRPRESASYRYNITAFEWNGLLLPYNTYRTEFSVRTMKHFRETQPLLFVVRNSFFLCSPYSGTSFRAGSLHGDTVFGYTNIQSYGCSSAPLPSGKHKTYALIRILMCYIRIQMIWKYN